MICHDIIYILLTNSGDGFRGSEKGGRAEQIDRPILDDRFIHFLLDLKNH